MIDPTAEQQADALGYGDPTGAVMLRGDANKRGLVRGFLQHGELAQEVDVDLSRLTDGIVVLRPRNRMVYVLSQAEYVAVQGVIERLMESQAERTMLELQRDLGDEGADRLLEKLGLLGAAPEA